LAKLSDATQADLARLCPGVFHWFNENESTCKQANMIKCQHCGISISRDPRIQREGNWVWRFTGHGYGYVEYREFKEGVGSDRDRLNCVLCDACCAKYRLELFKLCERYPTQDDVPTRVEKRLPVGAFDYIASHSACDNPWHDEASRDANPAV